jgi:hypothetical protein
MHATLAHITALDSGLLALALILAFAAGGFFALRLRRSSRGR